MNQITVKPGAEKRLKNGHLWVYQSEIESFRGTGRSGELAEVSDRRGNFLGVGYYNQVSQIALRLLTSRREPIDAAFFRRRLQQALDYRQQLLPAATSRRLVFSEGDLLPGLIVDQFQDYLVLQILTAGMEQQRELLIQLLVELCQPRGIIERSDLPVRRHEGLEERSGCSYGECPASLEILDNGLKFRVDLLTGQKTGYFLDQSANRAAVAAYARERRVLDCFCHLGGFAIQAAAAGASSVLGVDSSAEAIRMAAENAALNSLAERCRFETANAFDLLREQVGRKVNYDLVILDPPAFTKSKQALAGAMRGYKEINLQALKLLTPGGILVSCSCSYHISPELFSAIINAAAADCKRRLRLLERRTQNLDHPILLGMAETEYLKCSIFEVIE